jgi:hypothetical protein
MQIWGTKEGVDITGVVNGAWSSDVLLESLDLPFDSTLSTKVVLRILFCVSGNQQGVSTAATPDAMFTQPVIFARQ